MTKRTIAAFDFDGTITTKDTFVEIIWFAKGSLALWMGFALFAPLLVAYKLNLYPNWKIKQHLFSFFFKGMKLVDFNQLCNNFCENSEKIIRPKAKEAIKNHLQKNDQIVIVSASIENWIQPFAHELGISNILCTKLEVDNKQCLTGRFASANCHGQEKVKRLSLEYPNRHDYYLVAYGDSKGDKELLAYADKGFYRTL